jgi:hypothetical protein
MVLVYTTTKNEVDACSFMKINETLKTNFVRLIFLLKFKRFSSRCMIIILTRIVINMTRRIRKVPYKNRTIYNMHK